MNHFKKASIFVLGAIATLVIGWLWNKCFPEPDKYVHLKGDTVYTCITNYPRDTMSSLIFQRLIAMNDEIRDLQKSGKGTKRNSEPHCSTNQERQV